MTFDSSKPDGGLPIAQGDDDIRTNQDAVLGALGAEHDFVDGDGAQQTGRHKYAIGTDADLNNLVPPPVEGSIAFSDERRTGYLTLMVYTGSAWTPADVNPNAAGVVTLPRLNENLDWTKNQYAKWAGMPITPGATDSIATNMLASPFQTVTVVNDSIFANPTGQPPATFGNSVTVDLWQDGTGGRTITFDTQYVAQGGVVQIDQAINGRTMLNFLNLSNGNILVTTIPAYNVGSIVATATTI